MICPKCKREIVDDARFCPHCGVDVLSPPPGRPSRAKAWGKKMLRRSGNMVGGVLTSGKFWKRVGWLAGVIGALLIVMLGVKIVKDEVIPFVKDGQEYTQAMERPHYRYERIGGRLCRVSVPRLQKRNAFPFPHLDSVSVVVLILVVICGAIWSELGNKE